MAIRKKEMEAREVKLPELSEDQIKKNFSDTKQILAELMKFLNIYEDDNQRAEVQKYISVKKSIRTLNMMYVQDENNVLVWNYDGLIEMKNFKKASSKMEFDNLVAAEMPKDVKKQLEFAIVKPAQAAL